MAKKSKLEISAKKKAKKKPLAASTAVKSTRRTGPRKLQPKKYKWYQPHKPISHPVKLPSVWKIVKEASSLLWTNKWLFLGITGIYALLTVILVQGFSGNTNVSSLKSSFDQATKGNLGELGSGLGVFLTLLGSSGSSSAASGPYQLLLGLIVSLAVIWALRQVLAGNEIRIRDTFYRGMYPLIPFVIVLIVICIQLIPFIIGAKLYATAIAGGIAATSAEQILWFTIFLAFALWSMYLLSNSIIALYIVTLSDMTPLKALRAAKQLVRHRRWIVARKMISLPLILLIIAGIIMLPVILVLTPITKWIFFFLSMFSLIAIHSYLYILYRELLNE
ncbi:MAG: hypothetical protein ACHQT9_03060 [Candidatus Saccharimonadales bacterium]